jgi:Fe-S-cluster-containing dehydrogenase component
MGSECLNQPGVPKLMPRPLRRFIAVDLQQCTGCRACELACSWHSAERFQPECSHIRVHRDNERGEIEVVLKSTCDRCAGEEFPLCIKFCAPEALKLMSVAEGSGYYAPPSYP